MPCSGLANPETKTCIMLCHLGYPCHLSLPVNSENSLLFFTLLFHALLYGALVIVGIFGVFHVTSVTVMSNVIWVTVCTRKVTIPGFEPWLPLAPKYLSSALTTELLNLGSSHTGCLLYSAALTRPCDRLQIPAQQPKKLILTHIMSYRIGHSVTPVRLSLLKIPKNR